MGGGGGGGPNIGRTHVTLHDITPLFFSESVLNFDRIWSHYFGKWHRFPLDSVMQFPFEIFAAMMPQGKCFLY